MLRNYLTMFIRLFLKQTVFTLINIVGLAVGLASCLLITLYVRHELSYDRFFANAEHLYRVGTIKTYADRAQEEAMTFYPVAALLKDNYPAVADVARMQPASSLLRNGSELFWEDEFKLADPEFFRVFDFTWLEGDARSALAGATDVVVTRSFAQRYFGAGNALGRSVLMAEGLVLRVGGVIEDLPRNTHLSGTVFASMALQQRLRPLDARGEWGRTGAYTYVVLRPDADVDQLRQQLDAFARATIPQSTDTGVALTLKPVTGIHLNQTLGDWIMGSPPGSKLNIATFSAIGLAVLLVACANFVNLSTARSAQRFQEVGLRLTLGARRSQLLLQFLGEAVLFVLLAIVVALALVEVSLPTVKALLGLNLAYDSLGDAVPLPALLVAAIVLGLAAGWYPALQLSGYKPAMVLRDPSRAQVRGLALKNVLVVLQFAIAIAMLVVSAVLYLQMRHANELDLGYDAERIMVVLAEDKGQLLKERVLQSAGVSAAALAASPAGQVRRTTLVDAAGAGAQRRLDWLGVDFDFFSVYDIALLQGRLLDPAIATDRVREASAGTSQVSGNVLLNASGARELGWTAEEAVGKVVTADNAAFAVVGVVEDTLANAYAIPRPALYAVPEDFSTLLTLVVRFDGSAVDGAASVASAWKDINPGLPLTSTFQSELWAARYDADQRRQRLAFVFAGMAVVISCLGLFGLANFSAQRRTKEIGVRKVLGGSVWSIVLLLTNDFSKLVLIANLIAWPVAYFAMSRWLENFAYRIDLTPLIFIGSGLIALCIAWVTVGGTAAKAASQKPVLALRYE